MRGGGSSALGVRENARFGVVRNCFEGGRSTAQQELPPARMRQLRLYAEVLRRDANLLAEHSHLGRPQTLMSIVGS